MKMTHSEQHAHGPPLIMHMPAVIEVFGCGWIHKAPLRREKRACACVCVCVYRSWLSGEAVPEWWGYNSERNEVRLMWMRQPIRWVLIVESGESGRWTEWLEIVWDHVFSVCPRLILLTCMWAVDSFLLLWDGSPFYRALKSRFPSVVWSCIV